MADRYDEFAMPLLGAGLMTSRNLALNLRHHLPFYLKKKKFATTERQDAKRALANDALTDKDELIVPAQKEELKLLSFEAETRVVGNEPEPRPEERVRPTNVHHLPAVDHKRRAPDIRPSAEERLPASNPNDCGLDVRLCHKL